MIVLYVLIACQLIAWGWFSWKGGELTDKQFIVFTLGMLAGQTGAGIETFFNNSWGTFIVQVYFFLFTALAGWKRHKQMKEG